MSILPPSWSAWEPIVWLIVQVGLPLLMSYIRKRCPPMSPQPPAELIGIREVARRLSIHIRTAREWSRAGRFPKVILGERVIRYDWLAVTAALGIPAAAA